MTENQPRKARTKADVRREVGVETQSDAAQLLEMAVALHRAGELARAVGLYEQVLAQQPAQADALHFLGLARFQGGDSDRAASLIREAIGQRPTVAAYHDNLGAVLEARGEHEAALSAYDEAERLESGNPDRRFNVAIVLEKLGRAEAAEAAYREAIAARPQDADFHYNLANLLKARGRTEEAVSAYRAALERRADAAECWNNLGNALRDLGRGAEAADAYRAALRTRPNDAVGHLNLGHVLRESHDLAGARESYAQAVALDASRLEGRLALAGIELALGNHAEALAGYLGALGARADSAEARRGLAATLRTVLPVRHDEVLERALLACMSAPEVQAQDVAAAAASQICDKHRLRQARADAASLVETLAAEPLLLALLEHTVNVDGCLESQLVRVREHLLSSPHPLEPPRSPATRHLLAALARQCFLNEYVYPQSEAESAVLETLGERLQAAPAQAGGLASGDQWAFARLAMYRAPAELPALARLATLEPAAWAPELAALAALTLAEPREEQALDEEIPSLASIDDPVSAAVRDQYEASPYPRWFALPERAPIGYYEYLARRFPHAELPEFLAGPVEVLAAGCGTGQEAVAIARARKGARVLGLDLSRRSLAYALRMARKLAVTNVRFVHGDLMHLARLDQRFHVIESTGVLHHMADPLAGWRRLAESLVPGGVMKLGLYSERARRDVALARRLIAEQGLGPSAADIRAFRARVLSAAPGEPLARLAASDDLYTMSACRDLLFHVHEQAFTLPALARALADLELEFLGFDPPDGDWLRRYRAFNPHDSMMIDLAAWERFEAENPDAFAAMYVFWCAKR